MAGFFNGLFQRKKEVLLTQDPILYGLAAKALQKSGVKYKTKNTNSGYANRSRGAMAGVGENRELETLYYIYVDPADESRAAGVIAECQRKLQN